MRLIGMGRYGRGTYPVANAAVAALSNRYTSGFPVGPLATFTAQNPATETVAAVNMTRRASGIFLLQLQLIITLAGADGTQWAAGLAAGVATGGDAAEDWLVRDPTEIVEPGVPTVPIALDSETLPAGGLTKTVFLNGFNNVAVTGVGLGEAVCLLVQGSTTGATVVTPDAIHATVIELP